MTAAMMSGGYTGALDYIVPLSIITGAIILRWEVKGYRKSGLRKEKNISRFLGWVNVLVGLGLYVLDRIGHALS
ncbi:CLC_0170 family protein [Paenibacillaceae bacterium WGS1546]|uniref:CLC_0170 family protein n=1 Tax=Cohnella sp. WGS1546 TaxID=3366810 RepID=UPI00372D3CA2